ncbi:MAG: agmatine deiminase family protein, partial [Gordonibacter sp.]
MFDSYRHPGEFEAQSDVFMTWLPDDIQMQGYDNRATCIEVIKALQNYGDVKLHVNCGAEGVLEKARAALRAADVDCGSIEFSQFLDTNWYVRDNGPTIMVNDRGGMRMVNHCWTYYGVWEKDAAEVVCARKAGIHMAVSLGCFDIVSSDLVSEGGDREYSGDGIMMCIEDTEVRKRNSEYTKEQVEEEYKHLYNVSKIIWLPQPTVEDDDYRMGPLEYRDGVPYFGTSFA